MRLVPKLTLTLFAGISAILLLETYFVVREFARFYDTDVRRDQVAIGRVLAADLAAALRSGGDPAAQRITRELDSLHVGLHFRWISFASSDPAVGALRQAFRDPGVTDFAFAGDEWRESFAEHAYTYLPVRVDGSAVGAVEVSEQVVAKRAYVLGRIADRGVAVAAMALLCSALAWIAGERLVGRPVARLMEHARRIGAGEFERRLDLGQRDELGALARSIDAMAQELSASQAKLAAETQARIDAVEQLRHADRLTTIGTLASGVAHELGTPLNVIAGRAQMIAAGEVNDADEVRATAQVIRGQADRMVQIVRQLLDYARRRSRDKTRVDLVAMLRDTAVLLRPLAEKRRVALSLDDAGEQRFEAIADATHLQQAVTNLIVNAIQATPPGGRVELAAAARPPGAPEAGAGEVEMRIADSGAGIAADVLPRIFDPFFTTKGVGEGTGLGLFLAHGIVGEQGGRIEVRSEPGHGSCFSIVLARAAA
ncbi:MAG: histidine kinase [Proteobacteria bacterium]|nr:MAG: histidine kinase [Pseudomonadota bacterium]